MAADPQFVVGSDRFHSLGIRSPRFFRYLAIVTVIQTLAGVFPIVSQTSPIGCTGLDRFSGCQHNIRPIWQAGTNRIDYLLRGEI